MDDPFIVTIDGPAGVGKTTLAKKVAQALGVAYLDTGAMFRATALLLGEGAWELPGPELASRLAGIAFGLRGIGEKSTLVCNARPIGDEVRGEQVGLWASHLGQRAEVREYQKAAQRALGAQTSLVAEGRDMGSVVFAYAGGKFFLDADPAIRARRRADQLAGMGQRADVARIEALIRQRDQQDRARAIAPLVAAPDACVIDTSALTLEEVFQRIMLEIGRGGRGRDRAENGLGGAG